MGACCTNENYPEERKIFESFEKINKENIDELNIINYDDKCEEIKNLYKNTFDKLGQFQILRVNFIKELKKEITNDKNYGNNFNNNYANINNNMYNRSYYVNNTNKYNINETQRILYHIVIMTLTLKNYLNKKYISNELEISLLELSVVIINKKYKNPELKLILFYISKMFEILFINVQNIQNILNLKEYLTKVSLITEEINLLTKEEKYFFIKTHIISLGEWFHNDYKTILIDNFYRPLLLKYYAYLFIENYEFIIQNDAIYNISLTQNNNNDIRFIQDYYNENDLIQQENMNNIEYNKKIEDLDKISSSIHYFFIICTEDIFTGKNIFYEFDNILQQQIFFYNLQNDLNLIKFKKTIFHILFKNLLLNDYSTTMLISYLDYIVQYQKLGIESTITYHSMIINLYGRFNNNRIFLDKYSDFVSKLFIIEIENSQKEKIILDELYRYINNLNNKNNNYTNLDEGTIRIKNYENIYFFINIFKNISLYYNKQKNIYIINNILIYLNNFVLLIRRDYKKKTININKFNDKYLYDNINSTLKNFNQIKNDNYFQFNENLQSNLSRFLASYILMINDLFQINYNNIKTDFDNSIIYSITILEIKIIKYNLNNKIQKIIDLLNLLINHLKSKDINDYEEINNYLKINLRLIKNQTYSSDNSSMNIQFTTFHLNLIYIIIILILFNFKNNQEKQIYIQKHNRVLLKINQFNKIIGSCFKKLSDINIIKIKNFTNLLQGQNYAITHISFIKIIQIIQNEFFNEGDDILSPNFRSRTLYQNDKSSEVSININTKNNLNYNTRTHLLTNNFLINDSFSKFSNDTFSQRRITNKYMPLYNFNYNNDIFSEKIKMPFKDNYSYNRQFNITSVNTNEDIISNKSSLTNFEIKI